MIKKIFFELMGNVLGEIIASTLIFVLGFIFRDLYFQVKNRKKRLFWRKFTGNKALTIISIHRDFPYFEPSGFSGVGDMIALADIQTFLRELNLQFPQVKYVDKVTSDEYSNNLILIGGPDSNQITRKVLENTKIPLSLNFGNPEIKEVTISDKMTGLSYNPKRNTQNKEMLSIDYGLIIRMKNPFDSTKEVIIIAGSFGFGTLGCMRYLISKVPKDSSSFECLIQTDVVDNMAQNVHLLEYRKLV